MINAMRYPTTGLRNLYRKEKVCKEVIFIFA